MPEIMTAAAVTADFSGITLPFTVTDMLTTAVSFMTIYGPWILLGLGVIFAPQIWETVMGIVKKAKSKRAA